MLLEILLKAREHLTITKMQYEEALKELEELERKAKESEYDIPRLGRD